MGLPLGHQDNPGPKTASAEVVEDHSGFLTFASKLLSGTVPLSEDEALVYVYRLPSESLVFRVPKLADIGFGRVVYERRQAFVVRDGKPRRPVVELGADLALELIADLTNRAYARKQELTLEVASKMARQDLTSPSRYPSYLQRRYDDLIEQLKTELFRQKDVLSARAADGEPTDRHVEDQDVVPPDEDRSNETYDRLEPPPAQPDWARYDDDPDPDFDTRFK